MNILNRSPRAALLAFVAAAVLAGAGLAGQNCEPRRPTLDTMRRDLALAASVATQLDEMAQRDGSRVLLIARAGQDLVQYGLRYSHLGIAYRDERRSAAAAPGAWCTSSISAAAAAARCTARAWPSSSATASTCMKPAWSR
jgi:hypothetical protein